MLHLWVTSWLVQLLVSYQTTTKGGYHPIFIYLFNLIVKLIVLLAEMSFSFSDFI